MYLGILTAAGTVFASLIFRLEHTKAFAQGFAILGLWASMLVFSLGGATLTGDASGMIDPEMLGLLWSTPVGTALMLRVGGLGLLIMGLRMWRGGLWVATLGGALAIWSFSHVGHVTGQDAPFLDVALNLHLAALALWIGILTPLRRLARDPETHARAAFVGHRFGLVAMGVIPVLLIAGGYLAYTLVGSFSALLGTSYGQVIILKLLCVAGLLELGAANKRRFVPALRAGEVKAAKQLSRTILIEWMMVVAILGVTAVLTTGLTLPV